MTAPKATGGKYTAVAQDRWDTLTIGVDTYNGMEDGNSKLLQSWLDATRLVLLRMIHGCQSGAEYSAVCKIDDRLVAMLGNAATELVEEVETLRALARKAAAA
jgi:hypothetical protein